MSATFCCFWVSQEKNTQPVIRAFLGDIDSVPRTKIVEQLT